MLILEIVQILYYVKPLSPKNNIYLIFYRKETEETEIR